MDEVERDWREKHSVNCYFCGKEFDERDGVSADDMNGGDGGTACEACVREKRG